MAYNSGSLIRKEKVVVCGRECVIKVYERENGEKWKVAITDTERDTRCSSHVDEDFEEAFNSAVSGAEASILTHQERMEKRRMVDEKTSDMIEESSTIDIMENEDDG